ncbi:hypothetical protein GQ43DRAFT_442127 [Delitschia confertaspora ATCC 74209]|uniref:Uncharacterized protein n=1 Tax=Delitschia confertaspora ATCC 74209 TaxID=1513339 RepID=A0A9P4JKI4_9PLEO|nr:hypothetical protein GQ43DRAFT_442127 [Delitschia confertaspora ATCC 74209]
MSSSFRQTKAMRWIDWDKFFGMPGAVEAYTTFGTNNQLQALPPAPLLRQWLLFLKSSSKPLSRAGNPNLAPRGLNIVSTRDIVTWKASVKFWENFYILPGAKAELVKMFTRMGV